MYEFWNKSYGTPKDFAKRIIGNPEAQLKKHQPYFINITEKKIANLCGLKEENERYALELAEHANTSIEYIVTDIYDIDQVKYGGHFDILYLEGGILHYFHDLDRFMSVLSSLLKVGGLLLLSDFHPLRRCIMKATDGQYQVHSAYFDEEIHSGDVAFKHFFEQQEQEAFPDVCVRYYTFSEIINSFIVAGFHLQKFEEHRGWNGENIPWEFTIAASK